MMMITSDRAFNCNRELVDLTGYFNQETISKFEKINKHRAEAGEKFV